MLKTYKTKSGDTWDIISYVAYGSELFTDDLMRANWLFRNVVQFAAGVVITLPDISLGKLANTNLPPWKQNA